MRFLPFFLALPGLLIPGTLRAQQQLPLPGIVITGNQPAATNSPTPAQKAPVAPPPTGNRYDVLSKMISPIAGVLLGGDQNSARALTLNATVDQVAGRLPQVIKGATFTAKIEYPGKVRLEAPVMGQTITVCRNGNQVWAVPGSKVQFLLGQFQHKPRSHTTSVAPLQLPFTAQQAVLLPALFQLDQTAEVAVIGETPCRVISGGLIPEVGKAANAEDFSAKLWVASDYTPKRIDIHRRDFAMSFLIAELSYSPGFPASTWQPPQGATDVYRCDAADLEQLLYVVMNSLQMTEQDKPWLHEAPAPPSPFGPQGIPGNGSPLGPMN
jgi:hypothetical protein